MLETIKKISRINIIVFLIILPSVVCALPFIFHFEVLDNGMAGNIISGLSLFIGFFFSLIFVISDRVQLKKDEILRCSADASKLAKLNAYIAFGQKLVGTISTTVYISLLLIVFLLLSQISFKNNSYNVNLYINYTFRTINLYLGTILLYFIVHILKEMYDFFYGQLGDKR